MFTPVDLRQTYFQHFDVNIFVVNHDLPKHSAIAIKPIAFDAYNPIADQGSEFLFYRMREGLRGAIFSST